MIVVVSLVLLHHFKFFVHLSLFSSSCARICSGRYQEGSQPDWTEILTYFRGSELQNYFLKVVEDNLKAIIKPQYVDNLPKAVQGTVQNLLNGKNERKNVDDVIEAPPVPFCCGTQLSYHSLQALDLKPVLDRSIELLSGGELQRFAIGIVSVQSADVYGLCSF